MKQEVKFINFYKFYVTATNNIQLKTFQVRSSWNVDLISQAVRGMQLV